MCKNGSVLSKPWVHSFSVRIVRTALLTCSLAAVVFHSRVRGNSLIFSNSQSINIVLTLNPARPYFSSTRCIGLFRFVTVRTGTCSAKTNFKRHATVRKKGVPSTKNTSARVVWAGLVWHQRLCHLIIPQDV